MNSRQHVVVPLALALTALAAGLGGCAGPGASGPGARTSASVSPVWHDPDFYSEWHDPAAVVLPPPPFTGFAADGRTSPMLPARPRPATTPVAAPAPNPAPNSSRQD